MTANIIVSENGRGRPVDPEVQATRLAEEAAQVRQLTAKLDSNKLYFASDLEAAQKLVTRISKHLAKAFRARQLLTAAR